MHHSVDQLEMLDATSPMTALAPISDASLTSTHQHLHGSYHSMNHMMGHHHPGHTAGKMLLFIILQKNFPQIFCKNHIILQQLNVILHIFNTLKMIPV